MNFPLLFKRMFALLACAGMVTFGTLRLAAAEHAEPAAAAHAVEGSAAPAHAEAGHGHAPAADPTFVEQFLYSYLTAYMFCLSIVLGALFLVILHHLFDASWSVPIRRVNEQLACLAPVMGLLAIPMLVLGKDIYPWMSIDPATDHALDVKKILFNKPTFIVLLVVIFALWSFMALRFRKWSVAQDKDGAAIWTRKARIQAAWGIYVFAFSLTLAVFLLMKSLMHQFFSTMYGVYYFAGSVWTTLATVYGIIRWLSTRELKRVIFPNTIHYIGTLFFAFTGLRTQIGLLSGATDWLVCLLLFGLAVVGKFGGSTLAARVSGMSWRDSTTLGALMNTRGMIELIALNLGLDLGVLSPKIFAMLVLMALVTTFMTGPVITMLGVNRRRD